MAFVPFIADGRGCCVADAAELTAAVDDALDGAVVVAWTLLRADVDLFFSLC